MNLDRIKEALQKKVRRHAVGRRRTQEVFWHDEDADINMWLESLELEDVRILRLEDNYFQAKYTLGKEDTQSNYVVYAPFKRPAYRDKWLLDIELYSESFSADRACILLDEVGVETVGLKAVVRENIRYFDSQERMQAIRALGKTILSDRDVQVCMMALASRSKTPSIETILRQVLAAGVQDE